MRRTTALLRPARGFSLVELVVVVVVIAVLAAVLLEYLTEYAEQAEKASMEQVVTAVRSGLHLRVAGMLVRNADAEIPRLAAQNPMNWLSDKPHIYAGEFAGTAPLELASPRSWYYDTAAKQLVYRVARARHLESPRNPQNEIRFKVWLEQGVLPGGEMLAEPLRGIRRAEFAAIEPYRWLVPEK
ncbi:MAG TPA: prepilin-type N-terminal cleavage/methylation domain-containing protein [Burkholderiales bacterium]|nr:prepilin-type N-terminal cleavage/methylation domain-containing protein [Burkholderiales bacterium]